MELKTLENYQGLDVKHQKAQNYELEDMLALSVAEMDFQTSKNVINALRKKVDAGVFGYVDSILPAKQAICNFPAFASWKLEPFQIQFDQSVVIALYHALQCFSEPNSAVLIMSPVYPQFERIINDSGRRVVKLPLTTLHQRFTFQQEAFEAALAQVQTLILCSPHNPGGQIWTKEQLEWIVQKCQQYHVRIISDEVHAHLTLPHHTFVSIYELDEQAIILNSPSKAYNLAGLHLAYTICRSLEDAKTLEAYATRHHIYAPNQLSLAACQAAYEDVGYLELIIKQIAHNYQLILQLTKEYQLPIHILDLQAGYLVWMDFSDVFDDVLAFKHFILHETRLSVNFGDEFSSEQSDFCIRVNIATTTTNILDVMERLQRKLAKIIIDD